LIDEDLAMLYLPSQAIIRNRLALAAKPYDIPFLAIVPSRNLDNIWNESNLRACEQAKSQWVWAVSRRAEGAEGYQIIPGDADAFPEPEWPVQPLGELIGNTFIERCIMQANHPGLLRKRGVKVI
jgi:hypothetical protein